MSLPCERIDLVPERFRIAEAFGWQPTIWGSVFLCGALLFMPRGVGESIPVEWGIALACASLGALLVGYEVRRRGNRTILVRDGEGVAVYRQGRLDIVLDPGEIRFEKVEFHVILHVGAPLALCAIAFAAIGSTGWIQGRAGTVDDLAIAGFGLACAASLASAAWTTFRCRRLRVPVLGSRWLAEETVLVPPSRAGELFPPNS